MNFFIFFILIFIYSNIFAVTAFKCTDLSGRVIFSGEPCSKNSQLINIPSPTITQSVSPGYVQQYKNTNHNKASSETSSLFNDSRHLSRLKQAKALILIELSRYDISQKKRARLKHQLKQIENEIKTINDT